MDARQIAIRLAIVWGCLFSLNSLGTSLMVGLSNTIWTQISLQSKFVMCVGIFVNWSGTMMAYISKAAHNIQMGGLPPTSTDTSFLRKVAAAASTSPSMKVSIGLILIGWLAIIVGCSSLSNNAFRTEQALTGVAYTAYVGYTNGLANGTIRPSADESNAVRSARIKLSATVLTVEAWRSAYQTNSAVKPQLQAALDALTGDSSNVVLLISTLKSK